MAKVKFTLGAAGRTTHYMRGHPRKCRGICRRRCIVLLIVIIDRGLYGFGRVGHGVVLVHNRFIKAACAGDDDAIFIR